MNKCEIGDCREIMRGWAGEGVRAQMCVTSPPYWGLRDYGTAKWEGGSEGCDHIERMPSRGSSTLTSAGIGQTDEGAAYQAQKRQFMDSCGKCGAQRIDSQLGLEETPEEYVANMVEVFRLVRELLADDGTLWLNLGDSYTSGGRTSQVDDNLESRGPVPPGYRSALPPGLKPKDLVGIPWRVAFALQADGWYLRSDIIWSKPNPMPESVTDRPTKAHEYLFLLAKRERYYYDAGAIAEQATHAGKVVSLGEKSLSRGQATGAGISASGNGLADSVTVAALRNRRSVWEIATQPYSGAHFATFPQALVEPCILAGSRVGDVVLDPFFGSGTVGQVAQRLGRKWLGCELNPEYAKLQDRRTSQQGLELA